MNEPKERPLKRILYLPIFLCFPLGVCAVDSTNSVAEPLSVVTTNSVAEPLTAAITNGVDVATNVLEVATTEEADAAVVEQAEVPPKMDTSFVFDMAYFVHQTDTGARGSAFLYEDTNGVWLVSNVHVFSGSTNITVINSQGNKLEVPPQIEVAKDRDMIRFRVDEPEGLRLCSSCYMDEPLCAYGDSGGAGVMRKLDGKVVAVGPDRVEVSTMFIPGNSGGPVVNEAGEVVGVSSYLFREDLPEWIAKGTSFSDTRRMAMR
jgi:hypothetical protein